MNITGLRLQESTHAGIDKVILIGSDTAVIHPLNLVAMAHPKYGPNERVRALIDRSVDRAIARLDRDMETRQATP